MLMNFISDTYSSKEDNFKLQYTDFKTCIRRLKENHILNNNQKCLYYNDYILLKIIDSIFHLQ